jgi:hypothetical protein
MVDSAQGANRASETMLQLVASDERTSSSTGPAEPGTKGGQPGAHGLPRQGG